MKPGLPAVPGSPDGRELPSAHFHVRRRDVRLHVRRRDPPCRPAGHRPPLSHIRCVLAPHAHGDAEKPLRNSGLVLPAVGLLGGIESLAPTTPQIIYTNVSNIYLDLLTDWRSRGPPGFDREGLLPRQQADPVHRRQRVVEVGQLVLVGPPGQRRGRVDRLHPGVQKQQPGRPVRRGGAVSRDRLPGEVPGDQHQPGPRWQQHLERDPGILHRPRQPGPANRVEAAPHCVRHDQRGPPLGHGHVRPAERLANYASATDHGGRSPPVAAVRGRITSGPTAAPGIIRRSTRPPTGIRRLPV